MARHLMVAVGVFLWCFAPTCADDWPRWRGLHRNGEWTETGIVEMFASERLEPKWRIPLGPGYTGPTVADGRVFVMDRRTEPTPQERVVCLDAESGELLWELAYPCEYENIHYDAGPRATVEIADGHAYALGAMGHLHCLNVADGCIVWKRNLDEEYEISGSEGQESRMPIWGISAAPLVYRDLLILHIGGRNGACVVALRRADGSEVWRALDDRAQYSAPIITEHAGRDVCIVWTGDSVAGLDPTNGKVHWRHPMTPSRMPIGIATPLVHDGHIFVTSFYDGSLMLRMLPGQQGVELVWQARGDNEQQTKALHSIISTPVWIEELIYGVDSFGELRCLEAATGRRVWEDRTATPRARWSTIHFVRHADKTWMFNERGELIIARLTPDGFHEIDRAKIIDPTEAQLPQRNGVCWSHPAFADRHIFVRNDREILSVGLEK